MTTNPVMATYPQEPEDEVVEEATETDNTSVTFVRNVGCENNNNCNEQQIIEYVARLLDEMFQPIDHELILLRRNIDMLKEKKNHISYMQNNKCVRLALMTTNPVMASVTQQTHDEVVEEAREPDNISLTSVANVHSENDNYCDEERIKEYVAQLIDKMFQPIDHELILLRKNIENLEKEVVVLENDMDLILNDIETPLAINGEVVFFHLIPSAPEKGLKDVGKLREVLNPDNNDLWDGLTGGENCRFYIKDIEKHPDVHECVMDELEYYIEYVQKKYPKLVHVKGGAIMSAPHAPAQLDGHEGKLHSDYLADVSQRPLDERPVSIIVGIDPFAFKYLPSQSMMRKDIQTVHVREGEMIMFNNACLHSGDKNESNAYQVRLFAYMVSNKKDFPPHKVMLYRWTDMTENARILDVAMPSENDKMRRIKRSRATRSHPNGRLRFQTDRYGF